MIDGVDVNDSTSGPGLSSLSLTGTVTGWPALLSHSSSHISHFFPADGIYMSLDLLFYSPSTLLQMIGLFIC